MGEIGSMYKIKFLVFYYFLLEDFKKNFFIYIGVIIFVLSIVVMFDELFE